MLIIILNFYIYHEIKFMLLFFKFIIFSPNYLIFVNELLFNNLLKNFDIIVVFIQFFFHLDLML